MGVQVFFREWRETKRWGKITKRGRGERRDEEIAEKAKSLWGVKKDLVAGIARGKITQNTKI